MLGWLGVVLINAGLNITLIAIFYLDRYVRCIKPNMRKAPDDYDAKLVLDQLKYLGMLEIIKIRKQGFPVHHEYKDFLQRYHCLIPKNKRLPNDNKQAAK